jgi:hypothetical protein
MNRFNITSSILTVLLAASIGCGSDGPSDDPGTDPDPIPTEDTTPPEIASTSPQTGATGQRDDVEVVIEFSEPMDQASVEGTLDASALGEVTLSWNDSGDTLTITPNQPLEYAFGDGDPAEINPNKYNVVLGSAARDLAGNEMGPGIDLEFYTLRRVGLVLDPDADLSHGVYVDSLTADGSRFQVGDTSGKEGVRSAISFDIQGIAEGAVEIESATFATRQEIGDILNTPYADLGSNLLIDHVLYDGLGTENEINAAYNSKQTALASLGEFASSPSQVVIEHDVTDAVADDLDNRVDRDDLSQYLLYFADDTDLDTSYDTTFISRDLMELQIVYLVP